MSSETISQWYCPPAGLKSSKGVKSEFLNALADIRFLKAYGQSSFESACIQDEKELEIATNNAILEAQGKENTPYKLSHRNDEQDEAIRKMMQKRAWDVAISPLKSLGMNIFMIYMSGTNGGIFSLLVLGYALMSAIQMLMSSGKAFSVFEANSKGGSANQIDCGSVFLQKLCYLAISGTAVIYVLYQCSQMGLLPVHEGDFVGSAIVHPNRQLRHIVLE